MATKSPRKAFLSGRALQYFEKLEKGEESQCQYYKCQLCDETAKGKQTILNGTKPANLVSHLKCVHAEAYNEINSSKKSLKESAIKRLKLLQQCVELTTVNKQPFAMLLSSGFQDLIANKLEKLATAGMSLNLKSRNLEPVKEKITQVARKIQECIKEEVHGRFLALMLDIGSKNNRSILGINIQFVDDDGNVQIRSIGMIKLEKSHTGSYLTEVLLQCLEKYAIELSQIISITTDNASNMGVLIRNVNGMCESFDCADDGEDDEEENANNDETEITHQHESAAVNNSCDATNNADAEIARILNTLDSSDEDELANLLDESNEYTILLAELVADFQKKYTTSVIYVNGVCCAAHTLQLAVREAIDNINSEHRNIIGLCREVGKFLRKQTSIYELQSQKITPRFPRLDCPTRWNSTYNMVSIRFATLTVKFK